MKLFRVEMVKALLQFHLHLQIPYNLISQVKPCMRQLFFQLHCTRRLCKGLALIYLLITKSTKICWHVRSASAFRPHPPSPSPSREGAVLYLFPIIGSSNSDLVLFSTGANCLMLFRSLKITNWLSIDDRIGHFTLTLLLPPLAERERCFICFPIIGSSTSDLVLFST